MLIRARLVALFSAALLALLWSGQVSATAYVTALGYDVGNDRLLGYSETFTTGEYPWETCIDWQTHIWWGDLYFSLDPWLCTVVEVHNYSVGVEGFLHSPYGLYASGTAFYQLPTAHVGYQANAPETGAWSASANHYMHDDIHHCYMSYYWNDGLQQQFDGCGYVYTSNIYLDSTWSPASVCSAVPATMVSEYEPGVVYASLPFTVECGDFQTMPVDTYVTTHFKWGELVVGSGANQGNPHAPWGLIRPNMLGPLEMTRVAFGEALRIDSGYRCPHGNHSIPGSAAASRHMNGDAVDIKPYNYPAGDMDYDDWYELVNVALASGFEFNESYAQDETHVHVDMR